MTSGRQIVLLRKRKWLWVLTASREATPSAKCRAGQPRPIDAEERRSAELLQKNACH